MTLWIWLWEVHSCEGGNLDAIVAKARAHNVGVMVKVADGATDAPNGAAGFELVRRLQAAGVPTRAWSYNYPGISATLQAQILAQANADVCVDVEVEYDGKGTEAAALVAALRSTMPGKTIGYCPLPIVSYHNGNGEYEAFNQLDYAAPQAYAGTGGRDAIGALQWTEAEWNSHFPGCNCEPAVYGADQAPSELRKALQFVSGKARSFGNGSVSVWSWQHLTPEHWSVIDEITSGAPTTTQGGGTADMTKDEVDARIREFLASQEFANAVRDGYGKALEETELGPLKLEVDGIRALAAAAANGATAPATPATPAAVVPHEHDFSGKTGPA